MKHMIVLLAMSLLFAGTSVNAEERESKWPGVDEAVVEKFARDLGREARDPYINTDQGDLLLFVFAFAGSVGGFIMGYFWHKVFVADRDGRKAEGDDRGTIA